MRILKNAKLNLVKIILLIPLLLVSYSNAVSVSKNCPSGYTYNASRNICEANPICSSEYTYNVNRNICEANPICSSEYTYNVNRNICETIPNPMCSEGTYNPQKKKCYIGDWTCPLGDNYVCAKLKPSDNKNYCSNLYCGDVSSKNSYENADTPEGANDKQPNGQVDESGNCLGTIYIFNGQDKRCRKPGTQTAFNDCCKKDTIKLLGLVNIGKCNSDEVYLSRLRNWGQRDGKCHYVGEYCSEYFKVPGKKFCVQKKKTFCCFSSPLARIIQEQGRQQLGISWGVPDNPNCRGFTPDEFQKLDFSKIDFSEWINNEVIPNIQNNLKNNLQNTIDQIKSNIQNKYN